MEVAAVGYFIAPIMAGVISAGFHYLKYQFKWKKHVKEELERLQVILPNIQAVVAFASRQTEISDQHLKKWLWQLRDVIDEADDVLDDFEYIKHEKQLTKNKIKQIRKVRSVMKFTNKRLVKFGKRAFNRDPNLKRLEEVVKKLDNVAAGVDTFIHLVKNTKEQQHEQHLEFYKTSETGLPEDDHIIGRDNDKDIVMRWLSKPSNDEHQTTSYKNISLLSIVGHCGMGKTTLLQHVYNDENITTEFPLKMWVCVSTNFDAKKVIADMLEYVSEGRPGVESLGKLQESLKSKVNSKKFLIVLDEIWENGNEGQNKTEWGNVLAPLASGGLGSKILITTRTDSVAPMIAKVMNKNIEILKVEGLEEKECLQLLKRYAFANEEKHPNVHKLGSIAEKIVKKLSGSPLLAKIMGGVLNSSLEERHWNNVLNSDIISLEAIQNDSLPILRLSYTFLPKHLQSCFAFCGIFPQNHHFDKDNLVRMWIAMGFIQPSDIRGRETMEDVGGSIPEIGKLTSLQELGKFKVQNKFGYRIGELGQMNDLRKLSIKSLDNVKVAQEACNAKLRDKRNLTNLSLEWGYHECDDLDEKVFDNLQPPSCLQELLIDKYKGVKSAIWMNKADFISNLEIIELRDCSNWQILPPFGQLHSLKSLSLSFMPKVKRFDNKFDGNDEHCIFPSLEVLKIDNLEALEDLFDAEVAAADQYMFPCLTELYVKNCPKLQELLYLPHKLSRLHIDKIGWKTLNFCSISKYSPLAVLKVLCCPNITNISLAGFASLRYLVIQDCPNLNSLGGHQEVETTENCQLILNCLTISNPSILLLEPLRSITSLQQLEIEGNDELDSFPIEIEQWFLQVSSSLIALTFQSLKSLLYLPPFLESLSSLNTLLVLDVPQLQELPNLPPSLDLLSLCNCHPDLMERYRKDEGSDWHKIAHIRTVFM